MDTKQNNPKKYFSGLRFNENIKNCDVYDTNNNRLGRLLDAVVVKTENGWNLSKFTIGGSTWEELLEDIGLKPDIDPVFPIDVIESVTPKSIKLSVAGDTLKSTHLDADAIAEDEVKLSQLSTVKIVDADEKPIGNIIDMKFVSDHFQFVLGDGSWKELLEDIGLREDIDFLISPKYIDCVKNTKIKLNLKKTELDILFKDSIKPEYKKAGELEKAHMKAQGFNAFYPMR